MRLARRGLTVVLGHRARDAPAGSTLSAVVIGPDGGVVGVQDKVQIDPSEEGLYAPGEGRRVFDADWRDLRRHHLSRRLALSRKPCAGRRGAAPQVVFHQAFHEAEPGGYRPSRFADPANTFHEKAVLCRAAENTCYVATVNYAGEGSPTTSAVARPDGTLQCYQPYGVAGVLVADLDLDLATGLLASRCRYEY